MSIKVLETEPNKKPITDIWFALSIDEKGNEGICAGYVGGCWTSLCTSDEKIVPMLAEHVRKVVEETGASIRIVKFTKVEVLNDS